MEQLVVHHGLSGKEAIYSGQFINPYINSINFQRQGNSPICLPTATRVAFQGLGITDISGVPLDDNKRMVSVFKAYGLQEVANNGAFSEQVADIINHFGVLNNQIGISPIEIDTTEWAKALIDNHVVLAGVDTRFFYNTPELDGHALAVLGVDIPSPKEVDKDISFLVYDPNTSSPKWMYAQDLFPSLTGRQFQLWRK